MSQENLRIKNKRKKKHLELDQKFGSVKSKKIFSIILKWFGEIFKNNAVVFYLFEKMLN